MKIFKLKSKSKPKLYKCDRAKGAGMKLVIEESQRMVDEGLITSEEMIWGVLKIWEEIQ